MKLEQPNWPRFLPSRFILPLATLGPLGRRMPAPGTWGSLAGLMYFTVFFYPLGVFSYFLFAGLGLIFAVGICGEAEFRMGRKDPGEVILDEFVAMPFCFLGWHGLAAQYPRWAIFVAGFALFRFFDITKPFFIGKSQRLPGGWGVVMDDIFAALATCASLHAISWILARGW